MLFCSGSFGTEYQFEVNESCTPIAAPSSTFLLAVESSSFFLLAQASPQPLLLPLPPGLLPITLFFLHPPSGLKTRHPREKEIPHFSGKQGGLGHEVLLLRAKTMTKMTKSWAAFCWCRRSLVIGRKVQKGPCCVGRGLLPVSRRAIKRVEERRPTGAFAQVGVARPRNPAVIEALRHREICDEDPWESLRTTWWPFSPERPTPKTTRASYGDTEVEHQQHTGPLSLSPRSTPPPPSFFDTDMMRAHPLFASWFSYFFIRILASLLRSYYMRDYGLATERCLCAVSLL